LHLILAVHLPNRDADVPESDLPSHHLPDGRFTNPWLGEEEQRHGFASLMRWQWQRLTRPSAPNPAAGHFRVVPNDVAHPRAPADELRVTWIGHSSWLVQMGGLNVLLDPVFSRRASPLQWMGPARFVEPGIALAGLPPIDAVLLSHDHYDHLDDPAVRALHARFGDAVQWVTPLGYRAWLRERGIANVMEMDWWQSTEVTVKVGTATVACLPAQHWTRRSAGGTNTRLWASYAISAGGRSLYFGADSGWFPGYAEIGQRFRPFDAVLMPVGAYEPRWFMKPAHMNPEEAVQAYREMGGRGLFAAMHWGTFRLTDEDPLEPPIRTRKAWEDAGLPSADLWIPAHGESRIVPPTGAAEAGSPNPRGA
jgi:N-acyl-phosphatidylethanolamine-hydrolysing phospholipase D